jgi:hypothetical protein
MVATIPTKGKISREKSSRTSYDDTKTLLEIK